MDKHIQGYRQTTLMPRTPPAPFHPASQMGIDGQESMWVQSRCKSHAQKSSELRDGAVGPPIKIFIRTTSAFTSYVTCQINGDAGAILLYALILVVTEIGESSRWQSRRTYSGAEKAVAHVCSSAK